MEHPSSPCSCPSPHPQFHPKELQLVPARCSFLSFPGRGLLIFMGIMPVMDRCDNSQRQLQESAMIGDCKQRVTEFLMCIGFHPTVLTKQNSNLHVFAASIGGRHLAFWLVWWSTDVQPAAICWLLYHSNACAIGHCRAAHTVFKPGFRAAWAFEVIQIAALGVRFCDAS